MSTRIKSIHQEPASDPLLLVRDEVRKILVEIERNAAPVSIDPNRGIDYHHAVAARERDLIETALRITKGRQNKAAKLLSLRPTTLFTKIRSLNIDPEEFKPKMRARTRELAEKT